MKNHDKLRYGVDFRFLACSLYLLHGVDLALAIALVCSNKKKSEWLNYNNGFELQRLPQKFKVVWLGVWLATPFTMPT